MAVTLARQVLALAPKLVHGYAQPVNNVATSGTTSTLMQMLNSPRPTPTPTPTASREQELEEQRQEKQQQAADLAKESANTNAIETETQPVAEQETSNKSSVPLAQQPLQGSVTAAGQPSPYFPGLFALSPYQQGLQATPGAPQQGPQDDKDISPAAQAPWQKGLGG